MRSRVTIRDVAQRAGCSASTVSRALNGVGRIRDETRRRVEDAANDLSFRFDPVGRSLQSQRTRTIGALIPTLSNPVFAQAIDGVQSLARQNGYQLVLACSNYTPEEEAEAVSNLLAHRVDGLILTVSDAGNSGAIEVARSAGAPFVLIFNHPDERLPTVAFDNRAAAMTVAQQMLDMGHRKAAFIAGRFRSSDRSKQRYAGFCEGYRAAGAPPPQLLEVEYEATGYSEALSRLLKSSPDVTGLFCSNDMLALRVISGLKKLGRRTPEDLSVVGFDGIDAASLYEPGLATVGTPCKDMGKHAAGRLIDVLENRTEPEDTIQLLPFEFRQGASLAPAPVGCAGSGAATPNPANVPTRPPLTAHRENDP